MLKFPRRAAAILSAGEIAFCGRLIGGYCHIFIACMNTKILYHRKTALSTFIYKDFQKTAGKNRGAGGDVPPAPVVTVAVNRPRG